MASKRDAVYKHVPGMFIFKPFADLIPELFGPQFLEGEWLYDPENDDNRRQKLDFFDSSLDGSRRKLAE